MHEELPSDRGARPSPLPKQSPRLPPPQNPHRKHNRRKLQRSEKRLMRTRIPAYTLRGFGKPEDRPQIHQQTATDDRGREAHHPALAPRHGRFPCIHDEDS